MIHLLIARHGNTFDKGEVVKRVGKRTDLSLSKSGCEQARRLGLYLAKCYSNIEVMYTSNLKRTTETAQIVQKIMNISVPTKQHFFLDEIDYGPDEGQPEANVIARIGKDNLRRWEAHQIVPEGWQVNPDQLRRDWFGFGRLLQLNHDGQTVLVVTSNGVARFAPNHSIKLSTGAFSYFKVQDENWELQFANHRP